jgi:hypothetical protein
MHPNDWLSGKPYGYVELSAPEREAIMHFSLLWGLFEGFALNQSASARKIHELVQSWVRDGRLTEDYFTQEFDYFKRRYFTNGTASQYFAGLNLRPNDMPELVRAVLAGNDTALVSKIAALLIIVYRLRNNLFHGHKWAYSISDQLDNFNHANAVLMKSVDLS